MRTSGNFIGQLLKGFVLIGLLAAGLYGLAQLFGSLLRKDKATKEKHKGTVLKNTVASSWDDTHNQYLFSAARGVDKKYISHQVKYKVNNPPKFGNVFPLATNLYNYLRGNYLAKLNNGNFIVIWQDKRLDIEGRIFSNQGSPLSEVIKLSQYNVTSSTKFPTNSDMYVAGLSNGGFVALWKNEHSDTHIRYTVIRVFDVNAVAISDEIIVDNIFNSECALTGLAENTFVVLTHSLSPKIIGAIKANIFDNNANNIKEFLPLSNSTQSDIAGAVSCGQDKFVLAWNCSGGSCFQIFNINGIAISPSVNSGIYSYNNFHLYSINQDIFAVVNDHKGNVYDCNGNRLSRDFDLDAGSILAGINGDSVIALNKSILASEDATLSLRFYSSDRYALNSSYADKQYGGLLYRFDIGKIPYLTNNLFGISLTDNLFLSAWVQYSIEEEQFQVGLSAKIFDILLKPRANAFYINFTDNYLQNVPYTFEHTMFDCFNCTQPIIFDALLSYPQAGELTTSLSNNTTIATYNAKLGLWHAVGSNAGINTLLKDFTYIPAENFVGNFSISINIQDQIGPVINGTINMIGVPIHYPPNISANRITINQGQHLLLTEQNLAATSNFIQSGQLLFSVSDVQHGYFADVNQAGNNSLTSFLQQQVKDSHIMFIHDDTQQAPAYSVTVSDGVLNSTAVPAGIFFNIPPQLKNNQITIHARGEKIILTNNMLNAISNNPKDQVIYILSNIKHGQFELANIPGRAITSFTQTQIDAGNVVFVHDGGYETSSFDISLTDGIATTSPVAGGISFYPGVSNKDKDKDVLLPTLVSTGVGVVALTGGIIGVWRYRKTQALAEERNKYPLAEVLRTELRLAEVDDFQSEKGLAYLNAIGLINDALQQHDIDVDQMDEIELKAVAKLLARGVKSIISNREKTMFGALTLDFNELSTHAHTIAEFAAPIEIIPTSAATIELRNAI